MALSEHEQRQMDEMEAALHRADPGFAASVSIDRARRRRVVAWKLNLAGGAQAGRMTAQPGWKWSEHAKPVATGKEHLSGATTVDGQRPARIRPTTRIKTWTGGVADVVAARRISRPMSGTEDRRSRQMPRVHNVIRTQ